MRPGDHICVDRGSVKDDGIYISKEQVIHFSRGPSLDDKDFVICSTTLKEFAPGGWNTWVGVVDYRERPHFTYFEVMSRAKSQLGRHGYNGLDDHNCAHFARWCATGEPSHAVHPGERRTFEQAETTIGEYDSQT